MNPLLQHENFKPQLLWAWDPRGSTGALLFGEYKNSQSSSSSETRLQINGYAGLKRKLGLIKGFAVSRIGLSGGLAPLWWDNVDIDIQISSPFYIDALVNQEVVV